MRETIVDRAYAKTLLPPRKEDGHKGDFGKLLVLGGSVGYTGAPYLAASAARQSLPSVSGSGNGIALTHFCASTAQMLSGTPRYTSPQPECTAALAARYGAPV